MPSILVVDDDTDSLTIAKSFLENNGYTVHAFNKPELALKHVKDGCTDCKVIVADIKMPEMSGFELTRRLKETDPEIKAVLMSSFVIHKEEFRKVMPSLDVDDFVMKPFTKDDLVAAIKECAKNKE